MNARDLFKGRTPNVSLAHRSTYAQEADFRKLCGNQAGTGGSGSPRIDIVFRKTRRDGADDQPGADRRDGTGSEPGNVFPIDESPAVLEAVAPVRSGVAPDTFEALVAPFGPREFIEACYAKKQPILLRGEEGRFSSLIDWDDLTRLVATGLLEPRMRLFRDGSPISAANCRPPRHGHGWRSGRYPRSAMLDDHRLMSLLRRGTTLILDEVQEYHPPIGALADSLEETLGSYAHVNLYASWQATRGFATHWDDHDVFIIQVAGCKRWDIFGEARRFPLREDSTGNTHAPATVVWSGVLRTGDVLYIPRGWWHDARTEPAAEEQGAGSLHLTCSVDAVTGMDVLEWLKARLANHEAFRRDLPIWAHAGASGPHYDELRDLIVSALDGDLAAQLRHHFFATWSERSRPRPHEYVEPWRSPDWDDCEIRLRGGRRATVVDEDTDGTIAVTADAHRWRFDRRCRELIDSLVDAGRMRISELESIAAKRFPPGFAGAFARLLIEEGMVEAVLPKCGPTSPNERPAG